MMEYQLGTEASLEMKTTINNTEMVSASLEFTVHSLIGVVGKTQINK